MAIEISSLQSLPLVALALGLGCRSAPAPGADSMTGELRDGSPAPGTGALSARERSAIVTRLEMSGVPAGDVTFHGRRVFVQSDAFSYADDLLQSSVPTLDKGSVPTRVALDASGFPDCSAAACGGVAPVQYARAAGAGELSFWRPDTTRTYFLVVEDAAPSYFTETPADAGAHAAGGILGAAAAAIVGASTSDCLEPALFRVLRESEYRALPPSTREAGYAVRITTGPFFEVCSRAAVACANLPRLDAGADAGANARLRFGDHIAFVDTALVTPTSALVELSDYAIGVATHELLHTLGLGHPQPSSLGEQVVPGTASGEAHASIMHASSSSLSWHPTLQADDRALLEQLYSRPCEYSADFRSITAGGIADAAVDAAESGSAAPDTGAGALAPD